MSVHIRNLSIMFNVYLRNYHLRLRRVAGIQLAVAGAVHRMNMKNRTHRKRLRSFLSLLYKRQLLFVLAAAAIINTDVIKLLRGK